MAHSMQLGCERIWSRLQTRAELGLAADTCWIATSLIAPRVSVQHPSPSMTEMQLRRAIQSLMGELRWNVPSLKFGLLMIQPSAGDCPVLSFADQFDCVSVACDAARILDWMCAADAWLVSDASPLSKAIQEIAPTLQLPCFAISSSPSENRDDCRSMMILAQKIAEVLQQNKASFQNASLVVAGSPRGAVDSAPTIDSVQNRLRIVLNEAGNSDSFQAEGSPLWRAA